MALETFKFKKGRESRDGIAGYLGAKLLAFGSVTVDTGTTQAVSFTDIKATDLIIASMGTAGTTACYIVGYAIVAGTGFTFTVSTDPSTNRPTINYIIVRPS